MPVVEFTGTEIEWRSNGTATITQQAYARKLAAKYKGKVQPRATPIPTSKQAACDRFEALEPAPKEKCMDIALYLSGMGDIGWPTIMCSPQLSYYHSYLGQFMIQRSKPTISCFISSVTSLATQRLASPTVGRYAFPWA